MGELSPLQQMRCEYKPKLPPILTHLQKVSVVAAPNEGSVKPNETIAKAFPHISAQFPLTFKADHAQTFSPLRLGVVLSGGQASGGHNVICGLFDALKQLNSGSRLYGFLDGPKGIVDSKYCELTTEMIAPYRNQGGFDMIGSGRDKIESDAQFRAAEAVMRSLALDGLVIIGGDDSNTNAAFLAEYFASTGCKTCVIGVPKTIDGDLKNSDIEISFGFDTACKTYADTIGSLMRDTLSAKKYYYFVKLMGRAASHIALECALQTHPNLALISEEVAEKRQTLDGLVKQVSILIRERAAQGKDYGVILIPEGLIEFIPEIKFLIEELNSLLSPDKPHHQVIEALNARDEKVAYVISKLSSESARSIQSLPKDIQAQLLIGRDAHGNVQVSKVETERLLIEMVKKQLKAYTQEGSYKGAFSPQPFFCGYEGRACLPSNFDSHYCYALGHVAALLVNHKANGYICCLKNLAQPISQWQPGGIPLTSMMAMEQRHGKPKPVIQKALVDLQGAPFSLFAKGRAQWALQDMYLNPGPIQFFGPTEITDSITSTLELEAEAGNSTQSR